MDIAGFVRRQRNSSVRLLFRGLLPLRYFARRFFSPSATRLAIRPDSLSVPVYFINLKKRRDRLRETRKEFDKAGLRNWSRFEAISDENGALGCALSHFALMDGLRESESPFMVCEDDIEFLVGPEEIKATLQDFFDNPALDVLCLAYRLGSKPFPVSSLLAITTNTQTASCYVVKRRAAEKLRQSFAESIDLIRGGTPIGLSAIDQHWKKMQRRTLVFAIPLVRAAQQRPSFSDIERNDVSYGV